MLWCGVVVLEMQCCYGGVVVFFRVVLLCYLVKYAVLFWLSSVIEL